ncbi:MFS transporter [Amnibacterium kyonggiense]
MTDLERYVMPTRLRIQLGLLAACLFVVGTNGFVIAGLLPEVARDLGVRPAAIGATISAYAVVVAIASPAASILLVRAPRVLVLAGGVLVVGIGTAVAVTAGGFPQFLIGRVVAGLGGAALVPAATAAAPTVLPPQHRGRALAIAGLGFTLAVAVGSPIGTALASVGGWRLSLTVLAVLALVLAAAVALVVRGLPEPARIPLAARFAPLADPRIVLLLLAVVLATASFNIVYIYSAEVTRAATGGDGVRLAVLLLVYGAAGVVGTTLAGRLTDRRGAPRSPSAPSPRRPSSSWCSPSSPRPTCSTSPCSRCGASPRSPSSCPSSTGWSASTRLRRASPCPGTRPRCTSASGSRRSSAPRRSAPAPARSRCRSPVRSRPSPGSRSS